jgi:ABC-2 type transport system ATP-binding protein
MITFSAVTKRYGGRTVLDSIDAEVRPARVTALLGPNGSGKSTLLHSLVGLVSPTSGEVLVGTSEATRPEARRRLGFCPDDLPMPDLLTAREYLDLVQGARGVDVDAEALLGFASGLRLEEHLDALVGTYSHGMKRKLQLIAALLHEPDVLVLDEPFRGLDPESGAIMRALVTRVAAAGRTVLISTHDIALAQRLAHDVLVLQDGRLILSGATDEVVGAHADLETSFLVATGLDAVAALAVDEFLESLDRLGDG